MAKPVVGSVVAVLFPFSDLSSAKLRPALVLGSAEFDNLILCQITSKSYSSRIALVLKKGDFKTGSLKVDSYIRPDKIFTAESTIIKKSLGVISEEKLKQVKLEISRIFGI